MSERLIAFLAGIALVSLLVIAWIAYKGYQTSITKAEIAAEAKKFKAAEGNKFKFGITRDHRLGEKQ